jgi:hypothetical protein
MDIKNIAIDHSIARTKHLANIYKNKDSDLDSKMFKIFANQLQEEVVIKAKLELDIELKIAEQYHLEAVINQFKTDLGLHEE